MITAMLWNDTDPKLTPEQKINLGASHYGIKHGVAPNFCYVNRSTVLSTDQLGSIKIHRVPWVLPNDFWIGYSPAITASRFDTVTD